MSADTANLTFVKNAWTIAAWAEELDNGPLARTIMNQPIVLFRDTAGNVGALEDRCCHRALPLSLGRVEVDDIRCGYHGLRFAPTGVCIKHCGQMSSPHREHPRRVSTVGCRLQTPSTMFPIRTT